MKKNKDSVGVLVLAFLLLVPLILALIVAVSSSSDSLIFRYKGDILTGNISDIAVSVSEPLVVSYEGEGDYTLSIAPHPDSDIVGTRYGLSYHLKDYPVLSSAFAIDETADGEISITPAGNLPRVFQRLTGLSGFTDFDATGTDQFDLVLTVGSRSIIISFHLIDSVEKVEIPSEVIF